MTARGKLHSCWMRPLLNGMRMVSLRRVITSRIEDQLSEHLLWGEIARGDTVVVDINPGGRFTLHAKPRRKETASEDSRPPRGTLA